MSNLDRMQTSAKKEKVCLNDLLLELFSSFDIVAKEYKIPLYLKKGLPDKESTIYTDKQKLTRILRRLLSNSLKFTKKGFIEFGYSLIENKNKGTNKTKALIQIYVKDTGIGIKPESQKTIFNRFSQEEKDTNKKVGGLGLGLAIAKENVKLLDGEISVKSEKGEGATFFVTIPYKQVYEQTSIDVKPKYLILIVEDEEVNYLYIETVLQYILRINCNILHAKDGKEAIKFCKENPNINLVFMDLKIPTISGIEATKQIRKFRPELPIIAQTAYSSNSDMKEAEEAGCNDFITKPMTEDILRKIINEHLTTTTISTI